MRTLRLLALSAVVLAAAVASGVGAASAAPGTAGTGTGQPPSTPPAAATVWLCLPGTAHDPCTPDLTTTRVSFTHGTLGVTRSTVAARPAIDCFYVYPTVSDQKTPNADRTIDPQERSIARFQAAMF